MTQRTGGYQAEPRPCNGNISSSLLAMSFAHLVHRSREHRRRSATAARTYFIFLSLVIAVLNTPIPTCSAAAIPTAAFAGNPLARIKNDFLALTRKTTTRHILLPKSSEAALKLKQKIRTRVADDGEFVIDAFAAAAERYSLDKETAVRGGLLGTLAHQGFCICPELDEVCFRAPLGEIYGPVESDYGYHLVLVCERTNCPKLDGGNTRIVRGRNGETLLAPPEGGYRTMSQELADVGLQQIGFWLATFLAAGVVSEIAAKATGVVETLPWEETVDLLE